LGDEKPYTVREFPRTAAWTYQAGSSVHELTGPAGACCRQRGRPPTPAGSLSACRAIRPGWWGWII